MICSAGPTTSPVREGGVNGMDREQTNIRLPTELKEQLQREAAKLGMSLNAYMLWLIDRGRRAGQE